MTRLYHLDPFLKHKLVKYKRQSSVRQKRRRIDVANFFMNQFSIFKQTIKTKLLSYILWHDCVTTCTKMIDIYDWLYKM